MRHFLPCLCALSLLAACNAERRALRHALREAGDNRAQLESVMEHYGQHDADSLKLRAAKYLIRYMPQHRSCDAAIEALYDRIDSMIPRYADDDSLNAAVAALYDRYRERLKATRDVQTVSADYLIDNIEQAFALWQNKPWARHLDFEAFCEYLLPYKCLDMQPQTDWRARVSDRYNGKLGQYASQVWGSNARVAALEVNKALSAHKFSYRVQANPLPVFRATTYTDLPEGTCEEACFAAVQVMRSKGVPVAVDFTPNWTARPKSHYWLSVLDNRHRNVPFSAYAQVMGDPYFEDRPLAKVFRVTYRTNAEVERILARDGWMPRPLKCLFTQDVTALYTQADTVECALYDLPGPKRTVYLAVFDNQRWVPVCWGERKGRKARFERLGRNALYMPVVYRDNREMQPAGEPFYLEGNGTLLFMRPDTLLRRTIRVKRKYGVYEEINNIRANLMGGVVSAADNPEFRHARDLPLPLDTLVLSGTERVGWDESFRYWRIRSTNDWPCDIAEVQFYDGEKRLRPRLFPAPWKSDWPCELIADDDALTFAPLCEPERRVGFDFGRPVRVSKIVWFRRSDGNDVYPGFEYTLHYWTGGKWTPLGRRRTGNDTWLEFSDVPEGAMLLLVCNTTGVQNRPFVYDEGVVKWL